MSNDEQQPVEEPRGIEVRVIGGGAPAGWERVEDEQEQVVRLRKTGVTGVRSMEDVEPHREVAESGRSRRRGWSQRTVTLLMAGVMGLLIIGALAGVMWQRGKARAASRDKGPRVEMGYAEGENPNDPFDNIVNKGEVTNHLTVIKHIDRIPLQHRIGEKKQGHIRPPPWAVNGKKPQASCRQVI